MRVIDDSVSAYGDATVVVALEPGEYETLADALDADVTGQYHVDHWNDPLGPYDTWREAAAAVVERADYDILVEHLTIRTVDETETDPDADTDADAEGGESDG